MFKLAFRFLALLAAFAVLRYVISMVWKLFGEVFRSPKAPVPARQNVDIQSGGDLKKDPVCGTFVSTTSSLNKTVNGEVVYFCSIACRDKFKLA